MKVSNIQFKINTYYVKISKKLTFHCIHLCIKFVEKFFYYFNHTFSF